MHEVVECGKCRVPRCYNRVRAVIHYRPDLLEWLRRLLNCHAPHAPHAPHAQLVSSPFGIRAAPPVLSDPELNRLRCAVDQWAAIVHGWRPMKLIKGRNIFIMIKHRGCISYMSTVLIMGVRANIPGQFLGSSFTQYQVNSSLFL